MTINLFPRGLNRNHLGTLCYTTTTADYIALHSPPKSAHTPSKLNPLPTTIVSFFAKEK
jgi:hypothetical protein